MQNIAVIGAGYVGLVTGACLAQKNNVIVIENNAERIQALLNGKIPFYEPGLDVLVAQGLAQKTLTFASSIKEGLTHKPTLVFSCVGTPPQTDGSADMTYVYAAAQEIGQHITDYTLIINKSTVPVGTAAKVKTLIQEQLTQRGLSINFDVASNPEFLKEGDALNDFLMPCRVVVGVESEQAKSLMYTLYKPFIKTDDQFITMDPTSAELTKYASNTMLATRISFMNQLALFADLVGADIEDVKRGMAKDRRIGPHFLNAGIGYGGSCFPKDVKALIHMGKEIHFPMTLASEVDNINFVQQMWFSNKISTHYGPSLAHKTIGIWGLAFKPETDDIRSAPALVIINDLLERGAKIIAYDPVATANIKAIYGSSITYASDAQQVLNEAHALVIVTEWKEFTQQSPSVFATLKDKKVFDGRNCYDPSIMHTHGIEYTCVGRNKRSTGTIKSHEVTEKNHPVHTSW